MPSLNRVILAGNLCGDPELQYLPKGTAVTQFNLAINRKWRDDSGQQKEEVVFIGVKAWGKQAETICQYLTKGRPILLEGRLAQENWDDKQTGQKRSKTLVTLESFQFLDSNSTREGSATGASRPPSAGVPVTGQGPVNSSLSEDDSDAVPF